MKVSKVLAKVWFVIRRIEGTIVDGAGPRAIGVVNALASHLIRTGRALGALDYDEGLGVAMYKIGEKRVPIFYSGMLSGAHAIDHGSFDRLIWHIKYVLNMLNENSSQLRVNR